MSNHTLMIEKARHMRPIPDRSERKCFVCKVNVEDECHFITKCPLYKEERKLLFNAFSNECKHFESLTDEQKFIFILSNEDIGLTKFLAKFLFRSFKIRESALAPAQ